jgi:hypothetical protein
MGCWQRGSSSQPVKTGVCPRRVSSFICLTKKSATSAREINPDRHPCGSTKTRYVLVLGPFVRTAGRTIIHSRLLLRMIHSCASLSKYTRSRNRWKTTSYNNPHLLRLFPAPNPVTQINRLTPVCSIAVTRMRVAIENNRVPLNIISGLKSTPSV